MANTLAGRSAIVTGAANGIGLAISRRFVAEGASVTMADSDEEKLEAEVAALAETAEEVPVQAFHGNVSEKLCMKNMISSTLDAFEGLDILVNASRLLVTTDPLTPRVDQFEAILAQNVTANYRLSQMVARRMMELGGEAGDEEPRDRTILNLSSVLSQRTVPELLAYSVSCAALDQLTRALSVTHARHGIRVNAIAVGGITSRTLEDALDEVEDLPEALTEVVPMGRLGTTEEAAGAALFLVSPSAGFITGQILAVDGGRSQLDPLQGAVL